MMGNEKLSWEQIREQYDRSWILLTEFGWPEGQPYPDWGVVHLADPSRKEFYRMALAERETLPPEIAVLFVGHVAQPGQLNLTAGKYVWVG